MTSALPWLLDVICRALFSGYSNRCRNSSAEVRRKILLDLFQLR